MKKTLKLIAGFSALLGMVSSSAQDEAANGNWYAQIHGGAHFAQKMDKTVQKYTNNDPHVSPKPELTNLSNFVAGYILIRCCDGLSINEILLADSTKQELNCKNHLQDILSYSLFSHFSVIRFL